MAWTKHTVYFSIIFVAVMLFTTLGIVGTDLINEDRIDLNEKSVDYILEMKGVSYDSGFEGIAETDSAETNQKGILDSEDNRTVSSSGDFLSTLNIKKERASEPTNLFKIIYNIPSSILIGVGLDVNDFRHVTNILSFFFLIAIIWMVWRFIRP